jgi:hypothetical protein
MKTIALLTLVAAIFAAVATAAPVPTQIEIANKLARNTQKALKSFQFHSLMRSGRRLEEAEYVKVTCKKDIVAVVQGLDENCNKASVEASPVGYQVDNCVAVESNSVKFSVNGTIITHKTYIGDAKCTGTPITMEYTENDCSTGMIFGIFKGDGLHMEGGGTESDCSDSKPIANGMLIIPDRCLPGEDESFKLKCDSDKVEMQHYTDEKCGTKGEKEEHKEGECFNVNGAMGRSFFTLALALPTIALLYLQ